MKQRIRIKKAAAARYRRDRNALHVTDNMDEYCKFLRDLTADLVNAPGEVKEFFRKLLEKPSELWIFNWQITSRTSATMLFKPSQRLIDGATALRAGNFDFFIVEQSHGSSLVVNDLVRDSILPALEEPPQKDGDLTG